MPEMSRIRWFGVTIPSLRRKKGLGRGKRDSQPSPKGGYSAKKQKPKIDAFQSNPTATPCNRTAPEIRHKAALLPWRPAIDPQIRLGDLLLRSKLVTEKQIADALERMRSQGGRLGDHLVATEAIDKETLEAFVHRIPKEPANIAETGISDTDLLGLFMKVIYSSKLEKLGEIADALKLPQHIAMELGRMAVDRQLLYTLSAQVDDSILEMRYGMTDEGKRWTLDVLKQSGYVGPVPVPLKDFVERMNLQKPTNERITKELVMDAIRGLTIDQTIVEQVGPALNSGRAILLYGPPGNGKSSVAACVSHVFRDLIHIPYAISVEGQIIRYYDPRIHTQPPAPETKTEEMGASEIPTFRREAHDMRWITCKRPFVMAGGELTLDMLDLRYDEIGHFYEAPLHMKATGGIFLIDDFGRQFVSPRDMLNRWIVPMENRVDYLKLKTGASFTVPFQEVVIFATNLDPEDLVDPAFLRRLPYKIEVGAPNLEQFRQIFDLECQRHSLILTEDMFKFMVYMIRQEKGLELAGFQPVFICDQVIATCRFLGKPPELKSPWVDYAINNLRTRRNPDSRRDSRQTLSLQQANASKDSHEMAEY
jgi:hypothetical protein